MNIANLIKVLQAREAGETIQATDKHIMSAVWVKVDTLHNINLDKYVYRVKPKVPATPLSIEVYVGNDYNTLAAPAPTENYKRVRYFLDDGLTQAFEDLLVYAEASITNGVIPVELLKVRELLAARGRCDASDN